MEILGIHSSGAEFFAPSFLGRLFLSLIRSCSFYQASARLIIYLKGRRTTELNRYHFISVMRLLARRFS